MVVGFGRESHPTLITYWIYNPVTMFDAEASGLMQAILKQL